MKNPFPYSNDNKRYYTMNYYLKEHYQNKVAKVPLNAGFTCPNRDGTKGVGGCSFCSSMGSGDSILAFGDDLKKQYELGLERMQKKWPNCYGIAYFQSYSNTYAPLDLLKQIYDPFFEDPNVKGVAIATRADCLKDETIEYLNEQSKKKDVWIELGLQSIHEKTMDRLNRKHKTKEVWQKINQLKATSIHSCIHIMNSLPNESEDEMLETIKKIAYYHPDAIKIHMLHLIKGTRLALEYERKPFHLMSLEEYVDLVVKQLEYLPQDIIIERLTGDGLADDLIAPLWTIKKTIVLNEIDKRMVQLNTYQGRLAQ